MRKRPNKHDLFGKVEKAKLVSFKTKQCRVEKQEQSVIR